MATKNSGWLCTHSTSIESSTNTSVTIKVTCYWQNNGWHYDINDVSAWVYCDGQAKQVMSSSWVHANSSNSQKVTLGSATFTISKSTSTKSISCYGKITSNSSYVSGTKTSSASSVSVPAKPSYKISYNANGGSGAPSSQTKWYSTNITLSSTKPTRTGYSFKGWGTSSSDTTVDYNPGATYSSNAAITLYAIWKANTYTVSYNANGGSGAPSSQTKTYGKTLTLSSTKPTRTNYNFKGWGTSSSSTTASYQPGGSYTANSKITLYAIWELAYKKPRISSYSVTRCDSSGTVNEEGTYARVKFNWACDKTVSSIKIEWKLGTSSSYPSGNSVSISKISGTSGSVNKIIGSNLLDTNSTYDIRVTVSDGSGTVYSSSSTRTLNGLEFLIDFLSKGNGVAFGKPAELNDYADFSYRTLFRKPAYLSNETALYGKSTDGTNCSLIYINSNNNTVIGYGSYINSIGSVNLYGNNVSITSNNHVKIGGCIVAENNILWSGAWWMKNSQTCTLSSPISSQANGIILVWSTYTNSGAPGDYDFNTEFVPKQYISSHSGKGLVSKLSTGNGGIYAEKYLYINNTRIIGYDNNAAGAYTSASGVKLTPNNFVLRYVIGV